MTTVRAGFPAALLDSLAPDLVVLDPDLSLRATVVGGRVARLGHAAAQVLVTAAVIGRDFDLELLECATRVPVDDLLDALKRGGSPVGGKTPKKTLRNAKLDQYPILQSAILERQLHSSSLSGSYIGAVFARGCTGATRRHLATSRTRGDRVSRSELPTE